MDSTSAPTLEWAPPRPPADRVRTEREWTSVTPLSVVKHFRLREMGGLPKFNNGRSELGVIRLLVKSRAPVLETGKNDKETEEVQEVVVPTKLKVCKVGKSKGARSWDSDLKYTFMTLKDSSVDKKNLKIMFMDEKILILDTRGSKTSIHVTEFDVWLNRSLTKRYTVWGDSKSNSSSSRSSSVKVDMINGVEMKGSNVIKERDILVLMSKSKISTYDAQSGKLLDSIDLEGVDTHRTFHCVGLSCFEDSLIGPCIKVERKKEMNTKISGFEFEFLLLSVMPLSVKYHIQILKGTLLDRSVTKCESLDGNLLFYYIKNKSSQVSCLADVEDLIKNNKETTTESRSPDPQFSGMKTVVVRNKPSPLVSLNMQLSGINPWSSPPCALGSVASNELTIYSLAAANIQLHRIVSDDILAEPVFSTYSSICGDILLSGVPHGFSILELQNKSIENEEENKGNVMFCAEVFSTESLLSSANTEESNRNDSRSTCKRSLRPLQRKNYTSAADSEKLYFFDFDCILNLFVAIEFDQSKRCIHLYLYDKQTKKLVQKLKPICIKKHFPEGFFICHTQSKVIINFVDSYIAISVTYMSNRSLPHSSYVYFVNLLGECVDDDDE